jgi:hypothetical protein
MGRGKIIGGRDYKHNIILKNVVINLKGNTNTFTYFAI